jgi:hypothetical protein
MTTFPVIAGLDPAIQGPEKLDARIKLVLGPTCGRPPGIRA